MNIAWRVGYKIVAYNGSSFGVGRNFFFLCVCSRNCIIVIVNIIVYILVVVVYQNPHVNGPNKYNSEISDPLHYSIFFILFCYTKLLTKLLLNFFSKDSLSCSKVRATHV